MFLVVVPLFILLVPTLSQAPVSVVKIGTTNVPSGQNKVNVKEMKVGC